jgi:hypothetical protein
LGLPEQSGGGARPCPEKHHRMAMIPACGPECSEAFAINRRDQRHTYRFVA